MNSILFVEAQSGAGWARFQKADTVSECEPSADFVPIRSVQVVRRSGEIFLGYVWSLYQIEVLVFQDALLLIFGEEICGLQAITIIF